MKYAIHASHTVKNIFMTHTRNHARVHANPTMEKQRIALLLLLLLLV